MRISVSFVLRVGGAESFSPLEKAVVTKDGERAMHRDGGYYVFITPMREGERISVSMQGYAPRELCWDGGKSAAVYLRSNNIPPTELTLLAAEQANKGAESITVVSPAGQLPAMLEGCTLRCGKHSAAITGWDRASGVVSVPPFGGKISQGQSVTVTAGTE